MNKQENNNKLKTAITKSARALYNSLPILLTVILLIGLINTLIPKSAYTDLFRKNILLDSFIGSILGSIMAGNPITSYIIGGELLNQGVSLIAVTAFLITWVTVGIIQFPAESMLLGKKFAILRNLISFLFSIIIAIITVYIISLF